jgi:hypothetical protein
MTVRRLELTAFDRIAIAVAALSGGALLLELAWPHELRRPDRHGGPPGEIEQPADDFVPVGPLSDYLSISERPLFTPDRRPFVMIAEAAPAPVGPRVEFQLTAVIIASEARIALLRSNVTPTVQRVALNQTIDGWTLAQVTSDSVVLRQSEAAVTVPLRPGLGAAYSGHAVRIDPSSGGN